MGAMKIGLIGCGNIAGDLCDALSKGSINAEIAALTDVDPERAARLCDTFSLAAPVLALEETVAAADFVVECAVGAVVGEVLDAVLRHRRDCLVMSVGGLLLAHDRYLAVQAAGLVVRVPSGALCGLDGVRAAREAGLDQVTLTTRKPPQGLRGAPYIVQNQIDLDAITEATLVFEGNALEAVRAFPANVNVAAALSLAGLGPERTHVRVLADPAAKENAHEVEAVGVFGRLRAATFNVPSPRNPKSSYLASLSAIAEIRAAAASFQGA